MLFKSQNKENKNKKIKIFFFFSQFIALGYKNIIKRKKINTQQNDQESVQQLLSHII